MTTYDINEHDEVVPYTGGRKCTDTRAWRDATELELKQRDEIKTLRDGINKAIEDFNNIPWGHDGDCGSSRIIEELEQL